MTKTQKSADPGKNSLAKKLLWNVLFLMIAAVSIWAVASQMQEESLSQLWQNLWQLNPVWVFCAIVCMLLFIFSEAWSIRAGCKALGNIPNRRSTFSYSAADIYFSAITPSATGGQPASVYLMMQDGISGVSSTAIMLINLNMCTLATVAVGAVCFVFKPGIFQNFGQLGKILVGIGFSLQTIFAIMLYLLVRHEKILHWICAKAIGFAAKLHLIRDQEKMLMRLEARICIYKKTVQMVVGKKKYLIQMFLCNLLQRFSQVAVTVFVFLSMGLKGVGIGDIWSIQGYVLLGSSFVPIPGGMGVADLLLMDGFGAFLSSADAAQLELLSRSLSFYLCVLICGSCLLIRWIIRKIRPIKY